MAARGLGNYGADARQAVPALQRLLEKEAEAIAASPYSDHRLVHAAAADSLERINWKAEGHDHENLFTPGDPGATRNQLSPN
jgi:hypothetical protein